MRHLFRQMAKTTAMEAGSLTGDNPLFLFDYLLRFLRVVVLLSVWRVLFAGRGPVGGMDLGAVLTYTLVAEVFRDQITVRTHLGQDLWLGTLGGRFLRPMGLTAQYASQMAGRWLLNLVLFSLPLLALAPALGVNPAPAGTAAAVLFVPSLALAVAIGFAADLIFGAVVLHMGGDFYSGDRIRDAVTLVLSGAALPLALYPWGIGRVFDWLPFAAMASAPLRVYTGSGDAGRLLLVQAAWLAVLWPLSVRMWRSNQERMVSHGG